jgi:hypothetical protein
MTKEHSRFQLEASKLGRTIVFQVTVFERSDRTRSRLYAETQCSDPLHFIIQFIVRDAPDFDTLLQKFVAELEFRGFTAERFRMRNDRRWGEWKELPSTTPGEFVIGETAPHKPVTER